MPRNDCKKIAFRSHHLQPTTSLSDLFHHPKNKELPISSLPKNVGKRFTDAALIERTLSQKVFSDDTLLEDSIDIEHVPRT